jgi:hypothetical protein
LNQVDVALIMKRELLKRSAAAIFGLALITSMGGCSTAAHQAVVVSPTGEIYVPEPPPSPEKEQDGLPPAQQDVWVAGYWTYDNARWAWMPGHWSVPPQTGKAYVAGHWDHTERGWVYTPGHWE